MVLGLLWSNIVFALPKCQGEDVSRWTMCKETYILKNGDKYVGQFKDGKFHGKGTYIFKNENKYVGDFKNGKFHGKGTYIFTNGDKYVGNFEEGEIKGPRKGVNNRQIRDSTRWRKECG